MKQPCKDCAKRQPKCHGSCEEYKAWHEELTAAKRALQEGRDAKGFLVDSYNKKGLEKMEHEHDTVLKQYRELRDEKDSEIESLNGEIAQLTVQIRELCREIKRLRQAVDYYERRKK